MTYEDGETVKVGDRVRLGDLEGKVVCSIDTDDYADSHPKHLWSHMMKGILFVTDDNRPKHYGGGDETLVRVSRGGDRNNPR